jgi:hypothetical protein
MKTIQCLATLRTILSLTFLISAPFAAAQQFETKDIVATVRAPELVRASAITGPPVRLSQSPGHHRLTLNNLSIATLIAGEAIDSWGTYRNMTHTKWLCGNSPAFAGAYDTNVPAAISSLGDVMLVCGSGPGGQSANWAFDVTQRGYFSEGGWVTQFHLAGDRNFAAVEAWNLANDFGWYLIARHFAKRKDWIGKSGPALNFGRGIIHLELGIGNFMAVKHSQDPNSLNLHLPPDSNYSVPRWWGKR